MISEPSLMSANTSLASLKPSFEASLSSKSYFSSYSLSKDPGSALLTSNEEGKSSQKLQRTGQKKKSQIKLNDIIKEEEEKSPIKQRPSFQNIASIRENLKFSDQKTLNQNQQLQLLKLNSKECIVQYSPDINPIPDQITQLKQVSIEFIKSNKDLKNNFSCSKEDNKFETTLKNIKEQIEEKKEEVSQRHCYQASNSKHFIQVLPSVDDYTPISIKQISSSFQQIGPMYLRNTDSFVITPRFLKNRKRSRGQTIKADFKMNLVQEEEKKTFQ